MKFIYLNSTKKEMWVKRGIYGYGYGFSGYGCGYGWY